MKNLVKVFAVIVAALSFLSSASAEGSFEAGKDYEIMSPKAETEPMVEEFFNYACGHCYTMEKFVADLKKNNPGLKIKSVPVELRPAWKVYVKAYYIGEKLNVLDKSHSKIFHRIHVEKKHFKGEEDLKAFFLTLGVTEKAYDDVANSYWLNTQLRLAKQYTRKNKIMSTPTFLVNKRYKLNSTNIGSLDRMEAAIVELSGLKKEAVAAQ